MRLGEYQELVCVKKVDFGIYLSTSSDSEERVLLPAKQIPDGVRPGSLRSLYTRTQTTGLLPQQTSQS